MSQLPIAEQLGTIENGRAKHLHLVTEAIGQLATERASAEYGLTALELFDLDAASRGLTVKQIASKRSISSETIKARRNNIVWKMNSQTITGAIRRCFDVGILDFEQDLSDYQHLTVAQHEVLDLSSRGLVIKEVAAIRICSFETVKKHRIDIYKKLGATNINHAVRRAFELGIFIPANFTSIEQPQY